MNPYQTPAVKEVMPYREWGLLPEVAVVPILWAVVFLMSAKTCVEFAVGPSWFLFKVGIALAVGNVVFLYWFSRMDRIESMIMACSGNSHDSTFEAHLRAFLTTSRKRSIKKLFGGLFLGQVDDCAPGRLDLVLRILGDHCRDMKEFDRFAQRVQRYREWRYGPQNLARGLL